MSVFGVKTGSHRFGQLNPERIDKSALILSRSASYSWRSALPRMEWSVISSPDRFKSRWIAPLETTAASAG